MEPVSVLIVGGGIAGASCAWHLRRRHGVGLSIRVLEAGAHAGGRIRTIEVGGVPIEAGATLIHSSNRCIETFRTELELDRALPHNRGRWAATLVIWDGQSVCLRAGSALASLAAVLGRYGLAMFRTRRRVRETVQAWERVYPALQGGTAFPGTRDLFAMLGLLETCAAEAYTFYRDAGIGERFVTEFIDGVSRINYGQCGDMNAFASQVSLAGAGLAGGELFSIEHGNRQLCDGLLRSAGVELHCDTRVLGVRETAAGCVVQDAHGNEHRAQVVVFACSPEAGGGNHASLWPASHGDRKWQITHATFVCGNLAPNALPGLDLAHPPDTVLTPERSDLPFTSMGRVGHSERFNAPVWKFFSRAPLEDGLLGRLFVHTHQVERIPWRAYPVLPPVRDWPSFRLTGRFYDASALETVVSTMETQALSGCNVANLIAQQF